MGAGTGCTSTSTSVAVRLDNNSSASAQGLLDGAIAIGKTSTATAGASPGLGPGNFDTASAVGNPVTVAESMVGTDAFGPYGCEDFVDAAYGRTTATGMGHDAALAFYQSLADRGLAHHEMPVPRGALVFSTGADGDHVDISRGDGTYVSGGVQGLSARLRGRPQRADSAQPEPWLVDIVRMGLPSLVVQARGLEPTHPRRERLYRPPATGWFTAQRR